MSEAKIVNLPGLEPEKPKEKAKKSAPQLWADVFTATLVKAIAPMGFKKHKSGRIVARLDMLTRERIQFAGQSMCNLTNHHMNLILTAIWRLPARKSQKVGRRPLTTGPPPT